MIERLVLASANLGKLREFTRLLHGAVGAVVGLAELGLPPVAEPHATFIENALAKARAAVVASGLPALADDSGLCVDHLNGGPGVHSARYAGTGDDNDNNDLLLRQLTGVTDRAAHYYCVLVLLRSAVDPCPLVVEGSWHGTIATVPVGDGGFGYDPLFVLAEGHTAAQLAPTTKDELSHRGVAVRELLARLQSEC